MSFALALVEDDPAAAAPVVAAPGAADVGPVEGVFVDAGAAGSAVFCPVEPDCDSGTETALVELPPVPLLSVVLSEPEFPLVFVVPLDELPDDELDEPEESPQPEPVNDDPGSGDSSGSSS